MRMLADFIYPTFKLIEWFETIDGKYQKDSRYSLVEWSYNSFEEFLSCLFNVIDTVSQICSLKCLPSSISNILDVY